MDFKNCSDGDIDEKPTLDVELLPMLRKQLRQKTTARTRLNNAGIEMARTKDFNF
jgi:hypothetical protein